MPFRPMFPRAFSLRSIRAHAPASSGVYGISNAREWIYIGVSDNIQAELLRHLVEVDTLLQERSPTGFAFEACEESLRCTRQDRLVMEYEPVCNRQSRL